MITKGQTTLVLDNIMYNMTESDILSYYLGVYEVPTVINSPLREDKKPSLGLYSINGNRIFYRDFSTGDKGGIFDLLGHIWGCSFIKVLERINADKNNIKRGHGTNKYIPSKIQKSSAYSQNTDLKCKVREWRDYDIEYWESYGISLDWLKYAEVYPISHKIVIKNNKKYTFIADKYAYAYVERKEGKVTLKIYQPFNKSGFKWSNKHDSSVISLWTKVPVNGDVLCICSSLKDALCLWVNTGVPAIAIQGEGYSMSKTAVSELKKRYKKVYICLDNDKTGLLDAEKLSKETGFINAVIPYFEGGKDLSDYRKLYGKVAFLKLIDNLISPLCTNKKETLDDNLPF